MVTDPAGWRAVPARRYLLSLMARRPRLTTALAALLGSLALLGAAESRAALPEPTFRGPACPPAGCPAPSGSALGSAAGFATAAATVLLLARRRSRAR